MNRIAEWRKRRKLSQAGLAERMGTTQPTVQRLESGAQALTQEWMMRLSNALDVPAIDLLGIAIVAELANEVEPQLIAVDSSIAAALALKGIATYKVLASSIPNLGIKAGATLPVDTTPEAIQGISTGSVVVATVTPSNQPDGTVTILRQFISPGLLTTNRPGRNAILNIDDEEVMVDLIGVALPVS